MLSLKAEMRRLDSLCDKTQIKDAYPYFWFAKLLHYSSTRKDVFHRTRIRYSNGFRYKKDVYYYNGEKIKTMSVNDQIATVRWTRKDAAGIFEKIKMVRLTDSTMIKKALDNSVFIDNVYK